MNTLSENEGPYSQAPKKEAPSIPIAEARGFTARIDKGYDALLLIILLPCITFILAITLLGIVKPIMEGLGSSIYHRGHQVTFPLVPRAPISVRYPRDLLA